MEELINKIEHIFADLRYFTLFPRKYDVPEGMGEQYWRSVRRAYGNMEKRIQCCSYHWYVIEFKDGHKELAYLRVLQNGILSGLAPAIYRGFIPRRISAKQFPNIKDIRLAF